MSKKYFSDKVKLKVEKRAYGCCEYCQSLSGYATQNFVMEHIIPTEKHGSDSLENLAFACHGCNWYKSNKLSGIDPATGIEAPIFHPRKEDWKKHFIWSEDFLQIIGITPTGRVTVETLKLNREKLQNRRQLFLQAALHPPKHTI